VTDRPGATLQTLDRGLKTLVQIARAPEGASVAEIASALGVHRAIAYRIVGTLEAHRMVRRARDGRIVLGVGVSSIAAQFMPQFRLLADPVLRELARATGATAFVAMAEGADCVAIMVEEPDGVPIRVGYRVGSRHPLERGAAGVAILAGRPARPDDLEPVRQARRDGYSLTRGQLQKGAVGLAVPIGRAFQEGQEFCVGVVAMEDLDVAGAIGHVSRASRELGASRAPAG
jgi:DNA-binding IclR family transcriptional regulator